MEDHKLWLCEESAETELKPQLNEHNELLLWYISSNSINVIK